MRRYILVFFCLAFSITGCTTLEDPEAGQVGYQDIISVLEPVHSFGQIFSFDEPSLNSVTLWLSASQKDGAQNPVNLSVELYRHFSDTSPIFETSYRVQLTQNPTPVKISFRPLDFSSDSFYIKLKNPSVPINIHGRKGDIYPYGSAVTDDQLLHSDIAFKLSYLYSPRLVFSDVINDLNFLWLAFPLAVMLLLPGWIMLNLTGLKKNLDFGETIGLMIAISLAFFPVLLLWTTQLGIKWQPQPNSIKAFLIFCAAAAALYTINQLIRLSMRNHQSVLVFFSPGYIFNQLSWIDLGLVFVFGVTLFTRFAMVRDLTFPPWVDSVHHALFTRLIVQSGRLPASIEPILSMQLTDYHLGFHSLVAFFIWLSGLKIPSAILFFGQVLNASFVFPVYLLAKSITKDRLVGLCAAVISSFFTPMPAYYTSWGRYTQLAALLLLPAAFYLLAISVKNINSRRVLIWMTSGLVWGGLFLIHYRVAGFLVCLVISTWIIRTLQSKRHEFVKPILITVVVSVFSFFLIMPWLLPALQQTLLPKLIQIYPDRPTFFDGFTWRYLIAHDGFFTLILAGGGLLLALIQRKRFFFILTAWVLLLFLLSNLAALGLPGGDFVNTGSVVISLFLPVALAGGYGIAQCVLAFRRLLLAKNIRFPKLVMVIIFSTVVIFGAYRILTILNPGTVLAYKADLGAIEWINKNIPKEEKFLVSPFLWGYGLYAGSDGGYWIPALAGNETIPPPVLYGLNDSDDRKLIDQLCQQVIQKSQDTQAIWDILKEQEIRYVYIGAKPGILSPATFQQNALFSLVYHDTGVWIFKLAE